MATPPDDPGRRSLSGRQRAAEAPTHPTVRAGLLMLGITVAIVVLAALPLLTG